MTPRPPFISTELAPVLERIRKRLLEVPSAKLHRAGSELWVSEAFDKKGVRSDVVAFTTLFENGAAVVQALEKGTLEILECSLWILELLDRERAVKEALAICELAPPALKFKYEYEKDHFIESLVRRRAEHVVSRKADLAPLGFLLDLAAGGRLLVDETALDRHPALKSGAEIIEALEKTRWFTTAAKPDGYQLDTSLAEYLLARLAVLDYTAAVPRLEKLFASAQHEVRWTVARTLEKLGSRAPREALIAAAVSGALAKDQTWELLREEALWAVFTEDARTAYDKLAPYLGDPRLTDSGPPTIPNMIADILAADRWGKKNYRTMTGCSGCTAVHALARGGKKRGFYEADPRWATLVERMSAEDPLWEGVALNMANLPEADFLRRMAALERRRKRKPKPAPAKKKARKRARA